MRAITGYHRAANLAEALRWLMDNGFVNVNGFWLDKRNRYAKIDKMPASGKILIRLGV